jgi:nucleotide-binding universal stress UspA family protein
MGKMERQADRYLSRIAKGLETKGIKVQTAVLLGNPAEEIALYAELHPCDLVIMASHGRSGPSKWAHGSVAEKVFRASCVPLLMVRAPGCFVGI